MSINVYFKPTIQQAAGFVQKERMDCGRQYFDYSMDSIRIQSDDNGRYFMILQSTDNKVPVQLLDLVEVISCYQELHCDQHREAGVYRYQSAEAELEYERDNGSRYQSPCLRLIVKVKAKNMGDIAELVRQIKAGVIRPHQSYEVPQDGLSGAELRERVAELEHLLEASLRREITKDNLDELTSFRMAMARVRGLRDYLQRGKNFPLTKRGFVISILDSIIENTSSVING